MIAILLNILAKYDAELNCCPQRGKFIDNQGSFLTASKWLQSPYQ